MFYYRKLLYILTVLKTKYVPFIIESNVFNQYDPMNCILLKHVIY